MVSASFTARPPQLQLPLYYPTVTSEPTPEYHALNGLVDLHSLDPVLFSVGELQGSLYLCNCSQTQLAFFLPPFVFSLLDSLATDISLT